MVQRFDAKKTPQKHQCTKQQKLKFMDFVKEKIIHRSYPCRQFYWIIQHGRKILRPYGIAIIKMCVSIYQFHMSPFIQIWDSFLRAFPSLRFIPKICRQVNSFVNFREIRG